MKNHRSLVALIAWSLPGFCWAGGWILLPRPSGRISRAHPVARIGDLAPLLKAQGPGAAWRMARLSQEVAALLRAHPGGLRVDLDGLSGLGPVQVQASDGLVYALHPEIAGTQAAELEAAVAELAQEMRRAGDGGDYAAALERIFDNAQRAPISARVVPVQLEFAAPLEPSSPELSQRRLSVGAIPRNP